MNSWNLYVNMRITEFLSNLIEKIFFAKKIESVFLLCIEYARDRD